MDPRRRRAPDNKTGALSSSSFRRGGGGNQRMDQQQRRHHQERDDRPLIFPRPPAQPSLVQSVTDDEEEKEIEERQNKYAIETAHGNHGNDDVKPDKKHPRGSLPSSVPLADFDQLQQHQEEQKQKQLEEKISYLLRYETMVRQQQAEDAATIEHLRPCLDRLQALLDGLSYDGDSCDLAGNCIEDDLHRDLNEEEKEGDDSITSRRFLSRSVSLSDLRKVLQKLEGGSTKADAKPASAMTHDSKAAASSKMMETTVKPPCQHQPPEFFATDRQLMMVLRMLTGSRGAIGACDSGTVARAGEVAGTSVAIGNDVDNSAFVTWAEVLLCYKVCVAGMQTLQHLSPGGENEARQTVRDRTVTMLSLSELSSACAAAAVARGNDKNKAFAVTGTAIAVKPVEGGKILLRDRFSENTGATADFSGGSHKKGRFSRRVLVVMTATAGVISWGCCYKVSEPGGFALLPTMSTLWGKDVSANHEHSPSVVLQQYAKISRAAARDTAASVSYDGQEGMKSVSSTSSANTARLEYKRTNRKPVSMTRFHGSGRPGMTESAVATSSKGHLAANPWSLLDRMQADEKQLLTPSRKQLPLSSTGTKRKVQEFETSRVSEEPSANAVVITAPKDQSFVSVLTGACAGVVGGPLATSWIRTVIPLPAMLQVVSPPLAAVAVALAATGSLAGFGHLIRFLRRLRVFSLSKYRAGDSNGI